MRKNLSNKGFTLVEVLLVVVIIAILAAVVIVAINPGRQIAQANNTERRSEISTISNAIAQYMVDHRGAFPTNMPADGAAAAVMSNASNNICGDLVPTYIAAMPTDPTATGATYVSCAEYNTGYNLSRVGTRVTVAAPSAELSETISVTR